MFGSHTRNFDKIYRRDRFNFDFDEVREISKKNKKERRAIRREERKNRERDEYEFGEVG